MIRWFIWDMSTWLPPAVSAGPAEGVSARPACNILYQLDSREFLQGYSSYKLLRVLEILGDHYGPFPCTLASQTSGGKDTLFVMQALQARYIHFLNQVSMDMDNS